jgi:small-conductance mechanosensitive channel
MARLVILIAALAVALLLWYNISRSRGEQRKKMIFWTLFSIIAGTLLVLTATGRLHWITAVIASAVAMIPRLLGYLKYLPLVSRLYQQTKTGKQSQQQPPPPPRSGAMTKKDALDILGLKPGATREEILSAHKRMIQKVHPDRGGSDTLAAQINKAKDVLLG